MCVCVCVCVFQLSTEKEVFFLAKKHYHILPSDYDEFFLSFLIYYFFLNRNSLRLLTYDTKEQLNLKPPSLILFLDICHIVGSGRVQAAGDKDTMKKWQLTEKQKDKYAVLSLLVVFSLPINQS